MNPLKNSALIWGAFCISIMLIQPAKAQTKGELDSLYNELDALFEEDSLTYMLFSKADSLLLLMNQKYHSLSIRASYSSEVLTAGRDLGFSQQGFIGGVSYYHPSGLFADITGFMNSEYSPQYYLTDLGIGFMTEAGKHLTLQAGHNFQFFDSSVDWLFNKNAQVSAYYQRKHWEVGADYRFLYGKETAHRITATTASRWSWSRLPWIDRLSIIPSLAVQWGNAGIIYYRQSDTPLAELYDLIQENESLPSLERRQMISLAYLLYKERYLAAASFLSQNGYSNDDIKSLLEQFNNNRYVEDNSFGMMNVALNLGISFSKGPWNLYTTYSYNFPQALPGETVDYPENDYLSISLFYTLVWAQR
jgi:hypothetical protein